MSDSWNRLEELYHAAMAQSPEARATFLLEACPDDRELRAEVEALVAQGQGLFESAQGAAFEPLAAGTHLGNFEILELLGRGGMGEVYRARDIRLKRLVAVKTLPASMAWDPGRIARFEREARAASALNHPNIVSVYETGKDAGTYWIASELIAGESLAQVAKRGALTIDDTVAIGAQIADGLAAAHAAGIIHRDLKPSNVMLTRDRRVKILDFGLAKRRRSQAGTATRDITEPGAVLGTAGYMSPEQVRGEEVDPRTDLFSWGVVLYEMLCGRRAFAGESAIEVMHAVLKVDPPELPENVPEPVRRIVRRCLDKDRESRFQSAADLEFALRTALGFPLARPVRARRGWFSLVMAGAAAAAICLGMLVWFRNPPAAPRVIGMVQITRDNLPIGGNPAMVSDGAHLFFWSSPHGPSYQVSTLGGESVPIVPAIKGADVLGVNRQTAEYLLCRYVVTGCELWAESMTGGSPRRLGDLITDGESAAWSPDGSELAYPHDRQLWVARRDGAEKRSLATVAGFIYSPRWSPDGRRIRFTQRDPTGPDAIWEIRTDGTGLHKVLAEWDLEASKCCGDWTQDGRYFVFVQNEQIWAVRETAEFLRRAVSHPVRLNTGTLEAYDPLPGAAGRVYFAGLQERTEFLRLDAGAGRFVLELPGVSGTELQFSRDGKSIAYVAVPSGALMASAADGTQRIQLAPAEVTPRLPQWSPDQKKIAFKGKRGGRASRIFITDIETGNLREVSKGEGGARGDGDPSWSPDGRLVVFGSGAPDTKATLHVLDPGSGSTSELAGSEGLFSPRWSPDGHNIAALSTPDYTLVLYDLATHARTPVSEAGAGYPAWSRSGEYLFFHNGSGVWRLRPRDRRTERIAKLTEISQAGQGWFGLMPDDAPIVARSTGSNEIYALECDFP